MCNKYIGTVTFKSPFFNTVDKLKGHKAAWSKISLH